MRICLLLPKLQIGGAEAQALYLLKKLDRALFAVSLCCLNLGDPEMEKEAEMCVDSIFCVGFRWRNLPAAFIRLVRYLRRGRFDILHSHLALADSMGRLAGWFAGVPVLITTEHGKHLWKSWPYLIFERMLAGITDRRICVSRDIMDIRARREGTPPSKLEYIPNAVDPSVFRGAQRGRAAVMAEFGWGTADPLVISVGRLVAAKNYTLFVEAAALLRARFPHVRCLLVGDGDCRERIAERIDLLDVGESVKIAGSRHDIPDLLAAADVFVLTSIREGLPVSLLEAMAAGKAVVGTSVGGIPDAIKDQESGLLVPPEDPEAFAGAVGRLLGDTDLRRRLGRAAAEEVESRFSIDHTAKRIGEIYMELYERKKGNTGG